MADSPKIYRFKQVDSTNNVAFRYAKEGAPSGSVFVAEYQTKGRGKWGRHWVSPKGKNLLFSILLRPKIKAMKAPLLTQVACRSVAKVIQERFKLKPSFRRPNDLLIDGRKICGVLVEAKGTSQGTLQSLVVGVGLNVNSKAEELVEGATSILEETGKRRARAGLLKALIRRLKKDLNDSSG